MKKIFIVFAILFCVVAGILLASGLYFKFMPDINVEKEKAHHTINANNLLAEFEANETKANKKYMDKVIEVEGTIAEISKDQRGSDVVALRNADDFSGVLCTLKDSNSVKSYQVGQSITIRGVCTGMTLDVVLNKCVIIEE